MPYTKKAFYLKFVRYQEKPPAAVATVRIDYDSADGEPKAISLLDLYFPGKTKVLCPTPEELEVKYGVPTGLCSWHHFAIPQMLPAHRPYLMEEKPVISETRPMPTFQPTTTYLRDAPPIVLTTKKPMEPLSPDSVYDTDPNHYCKDCHSYKGNDPCECEAY